MRILRNIVVLLVAFLVFGMTTRPAQADPHALFYTTIGQQQLFYNILAALDQADYVEPAKPALGISSGNSRQELLDARTAAGFSEETSPQLNATKTDLSSVITRAVTLEGNDLWSSYLAYLDAVETDRRRNLVELYKVFCTVAAGVKNCDAVDGDTPKVAEARRERAYIVDPVEQAQAVEDAATAALLPAVAPEFDQEQRKKLLQQNSLEHDQFRPYDRNLATVSQRAQGDIKKEGIVYRWVSNVLNLDIGSINPAVLDSVNSDNSVDIPDDTSNPDELIDRLSLVLSAPSQILGSYIIAAEQKKTIDSVKNKDGVLAQTHPIPQAQNGQLVDIGEKLRAPAVTNEGQLESTIQSITDTEVTRYSVETEQNIQGTVKKTQGVKLQPGTEQSEPEKLGLNTTNTPQQQVLGVIDEGGEGSGLDNPDDVGPERPSQDFVDISKGPTSFTREPTVKDILNFITGGTSGGCGCSLDDILNNYGNTI